MRKLTLLSLLVVFIIALLVFAGCKGEKKEQGKKVTRTISLRLVHSPEVTGPVGTLMDIFFLGAPILPDGSLVKVELLSEPAISAAKKIARGTLKTHVWLTPSSSLAGLVNSTRVNLGAEQTECVRLFETPLVAAVRASQRQAFDPSGQGIIALQQLLVNTANAIALHGGRALINHPAASIDAAGFTALAHLARYAAGDQPLDLSSLKQQPVIDNLTLLESSVSLYSPGQAESLGWLLNNDPTAPALAIIPEQAVNEYNKKAQPAARLESLIPEGQPSVLDYSLCTSSADWVSPAHQAAIKMLTKFLQSQGAVKTMTDAGFRPPGVKSLESKEAPESTPAGIAYSALPPVSGLTASQLSLTWPRVRRPVANIVVVDTSGSTEGDVLLLQKNLATKVFSRTAPNELKSLISYATEVNVLSDPVSDGTKLLPLLDGLRSLGSSLMYDAIRSALEMGKNPQLAQYQKRIIVFTDGPDRNSTTPIKALAELLKYSASQHDTYVYVMAVSSENVNYQELKEAVRAANGYFKQAALIDLNDSFTELLGTFD